MNKKSFVVRIKGRADFEKSLTVHNSSAEGAIAAGLDAISLRDIDTLNVDTIRFRVDPMEEVEHERTTGTE